MSIYPALRLLLFVIPGILLGRFYPVVAEYTFYTTLLSLFIITGAFFYDTFSGRKTVSPVLAFGYVFFVTSFFAFYTAGEAGKVPSDTVLQYANESVELYGTVESKPVIKGNRAQWAMTSEKLICQHDTQDVSGKVLVTLSTQGSIRISLQPGDKVWVFGKLRIPSMPRNKGEFDYREFLAQKKTYVLLTSFGEWSIEKDENQNQSFFQGKIVKPVYQYIDRTIDALIIGEEEKAFLKGIILGDRSAIPDTIKAAFQTTGTIHVLAISGFHVGLLVILLTSLLKRTQVKTAGRWVAFLLTAIALLIYSNVTGNFPPVKRAVVMAVVFSGVGIFEKKAYPINTLAVSDLIILTIDPFDLFSISFILTNAAVASIILIYPKLEKLVNFGGQPSSKRLIPSIVTEPLRFIWKSFALTIAATLGVAPFIAYYFGKVALLGLLANVPATIMVSLALYLMIPALLFNFFSPTLAGFYAASAKALIGFAIKTVAWFSAIPFASIDLHLDLFDILVYFIVLVSLHAFSSGRYRGRLVILMLVALNAFVWRTVLTPKERLPGIVVNDIGQGRSILFRTNSESVLIDAGVRQSQWQRIERQLKAFNAYPLTAFVQVGTKDSIAANIPARDYLMAADTSLFLKTVLSYRPSPVLLKIISKKKRLLVATSLGNFCESPFYRADVIVLRLTRFQSEEQRQLELWLNYSLPERFVVEPSPFLPRREKQKFYRYARTKSKIEVPVRGGQILIM